MLERGLGKIPPGRDQEMAKYFLSAALWWMRGANVYIRGTRQLTNLLWKTLSGGDLYPRLPP